MGKPECEGNCKIHGGCKGETKRYRVSTSYRHHLHAQKTIDWGLFWYCETAVKEDKRNNFNVTEE